MNRRGGFTDLFLFMIIFFIMMVALIIMIYAGTTAYTSVRQAISDNEDAFPNQNATKVVEETLGDVPASYVVLYWGSIAIVVFMIMSIFYGSYMVTTKPIFFVPYIILVIIAVIVAIPMANAYEEVIATPELSATADNFTGTNFLLLNLPYIIAVIGIVGGIIMFISFKLSQNEPQYFIG